MSCTPVRAPVSEARSCQHAECPAGEGDGGRGTGVEVGRGGVLQKSYTPLFPSPKSPTFAEVRSGLQTPMGVALNPKDPKLLKLPKHQTAQKGTEAASLNPELSTLNPKP